MRACVFAPGTRRSSDSLARGLPRLLSTLLVLGLLGGTAAAFAVTERLKLVPSPIIAPKVTEAFSPVCGGGCKTREARIRFGLRDADRLTVTIIDEDDDPVATIADDESLPGGPGRVRVGRSRRPRGRLPRARAPGRRAANDRHPERVAARHDAARRSTVERSRRGSSHPTATDARTRSAREYGSRSAARSASTTATTRPSSAPPRTEGKIEWYARGCGQACTVVIVERDRPRRQHDRRLVAPTEVRLRFVELVVAARSSSRPAFASASASRPTPRRYRWRLGVAHRQLGRRARSRCSRRRCPGGTR